MTDSLYNRTIDWNQYWQEADVGAREAASPSADYVLDALLEFLAETGDPGTYADVGCGAGAVVFGVAERYPETAVVGYDSAGPVIAENQDRVRETGHTNVSFQRTVLPAFDPGRQFDVVTCFFTLCYVADVERALRNLHDAVAPGGSLVFTYHNRFAQSVYRRVAESPADHLDESSRFEPETYAERFQLVLDGRSLLSYERIHEVLGTWPQSVWSVAENTDRYGAWRHEPLVYVPK